MGLVASLALLALPAGAQATTASWTGATNTDWATASNWSCACVPTAGDTVNITGGAGSPIVSTAGAKATAVNIGAAKQLSVNTSGADLTVDGLIDVAPTGALGVGSGATLVLSDGAHIDDTGPTTIAAGGLLKHQGSASGAVNDPLTVNGTVLETGGGLLLRGANVTDSLAGTLRTTGGLIALGDSGQHPTTFRLDGTTTFDASAGGTIKDQTSDVTINLNGQTLNVNGDFQHAGGTLAGAGTIGSGTLHLQGGDLGSTGALTIGAAATLSVESSTAGTGTRSIANHGRINLTGTNTLTVPGGYVQSSDGVLTVATAGPGSSGKLRVDGDVGLDGILDMNPSAGYAAAAALGDSIDVVSYSSGAQTGAFCAITSVPALNGGKRFTANYDHSGNKVSAVVSSDKTPESCGPPDPPTFTATNPTSPSSDNHPFILGNAAAGSTVTLYTTADCSGSVAASGSADAFNSPGLEVTVPDSSTTTFHGTATIGSQTSACSSSSITYVQIPGKPVNTSPPKITGTPEVGNVLTCSQGAWEGSPTSFAYNWSRDGTVLTGATSSTYTVVAADDVRSLTCTVTATNDAGSASATSAAVVIGGAPTRPPVATAPPVVVPGGAGAPLECTQGTWANQPNGFAYGWSRDGTAIPGATSPSYLPTAADAGHSLACGVAAANRAGSALGTSAPLAIPAKLPPPACRGVKTTYRAGGVATVSLRCSGQHGLRAYARCLPRRGGQPGYSATSYPPGTLLADGDLDPFPPTPRRPAGVDPVSRAAEGAGGCLVSFEMVIEQSGNGKGGAPAKRAKLRATAVTGGAGGCGKLAFSLGGRAQQVLKRGRGVTLRSTTTVRDPSRARTVTRQTSTFKRSADGQDCPSAPILTNFDLSRSKFSAAAHGVSITKLPNSGPTMKYSDSQPADTTWTVDRVVRGTVKGRKCVVPPKHASGKPRRCTGYQPVATFIHHDRRGRNRFHFNGNVGGTKLRPGKFFLVAVASRHHVSGPSVSVPFRIVH